MKEMLQGRGDAPDPLTVKLKSHDPDISGFWEQVNT